MFTKNDEVNCVPQEERTFSEEEEQKLQSALSLDKQDLSLVLDTTAFILEQVSRP